MKRRRRGNPRRCTNRRRWQNRRRRTTLRRCESERRQFRTKTLNEPPTPEEPTTLNEATTPDEVTTSNERTTAKQPTLVGELTTLEGWTTLKEPATVTEHGEGASDVSGGSDEDSSSSDDDPLRVVTSGVRGWQKPAKAAARREHRRYVLRGVPGGARGPASPRILGCPCDQRLKKKLMWILRHGVDQLHIPLRSDGFVSARDLVNSGRLPGATLDALAMVAQASVGLEWLYINGHPFVRALRGHTLPGVTLPKMTFEMEELPTYLVYITPSWLAEMVLKRGVVRLRERAVLLFMDVPVMEASEETTHVFLDVRRMLDRDVTLVHVGDGIVSCGGTSCGVIPPSCISLIRKGIGGRQIFPKVLPAPRRPAAMGQFTFPMRPLGRFDRFCGRHSLGTGWT